MSDATSVSDGRDFTPSPSFIAPRMALDHIPVDPAPPATTGGTDETEGLAALIRRAINDPGSVTKRAGTRSDPERLDQWQNRALHLLLRPALDARDARVSADALREAASAFQINTWADVVPPALKTQGLPALAVTQAFIDWLRDRADRIAREGQA